MDNVAAVLEELTAAQAVIDQQPAALSRRFAAVERGLELGLSLRAIAAHIGVPAGTLGQARHKDRRRRLSA